MIKNLIKTRNFKFLHPNTVAVANEAELTSILKAVGYFRNFAIFKALYTVLFKGANLTVDQYKSIYKTLVDYKINHPNDYFIKGFSAAILKSASVSKSTKAIYAVMVHNQLFKDEIFKSKIHVSSNRLTKAVSSCYLKDKQIHLAVIKKSKVRVVNNNNLIKSIIKWNL